MGKPVNPLLDRCVAEYCLAPGLSAHKMAAVLKYLADELMRDTFTLEHRGSSELLLNACALHSRLQHAADPLHFEEVKTPDHSSAG